jgi:DNA-binding transcriptional regulator YhcF (GntR family)
MYFCQVFIGFFIDFFILKVYLSINNTNKTSGLHRKNMIKLNLTANKKGVSKQIEKQLSSLIYDSRLLPGQFLPTVKEISTTYGINHQTVLRAYKNLKTDGLIESYRGGRAKISMPPRLKEIFVVFDIDSFTENLSPGYLSFMKKLQTEPVIKDVLTKEGKLYKEVRLAPLLSSQISDEVFFKSNLLEDFIDPEKRPLGLLLVGYSASEKVQNFFNAIGIPCVGVGSVGQYSHQTTLPFIEFVSKGLEYAVENKYKKIIFLYQTQSQPDKLLDFYKSSLKNANIKVDDNMIFSVDRFTNAQAQGIVEKIEKKLVSEDKILLLSTDDFMAMKIYDLLKKKDDKKIVFPDTFTMWSKGISESDEYPFRKALINAEELFNSALDIMLDMISEGCKEPKTITVSMQL